MKEPGVSSGDSRVLFDVKCRNRFLPYFYIVSEGALSFGKYMRIPLLFL